MDAAGGNCLRSIRAFLIPTDSRWVHRLRCRLLLSPRRPRQPNTPSATAIRCGPSHRPNCVAVPEYLWGGGSCRLLVFARCEIAAILRRKNVLALQVFGGVNVAGFFLLILLACAAARDLRRWSSGLASGFGLGLGYVEFAPEHGTGRRRERRTKRPGERDTPAARAGRGRCGAQVADPGWGVKIRTCHSKPNRCWDSA